MFLFIPANSVDRLQVKLKTSEQKQKILENQLEQYQAKLKNLEQENLSLKQLIRQQNAFEDELEDYKRRHEAMIVGLKADADESYQSMVESMEVDVSSLRKQIKCIEEGHAAELKTNGATNNQTELKEENDRLKAFGALAVSSIRTFKDSNQALLSSLENGFKSFASDATLIASARVSATISNGEANDSTTTGNQLSTAIIERHNYISQDQETQPNLNATNNTTI